MRQQSGLQQPFRRVNHGALIHPAVIRFVMFQSEMRHVVAQAVEEVVLTEMLCAEKPFGLLGQALVTVEHLLWRVQSSCAVGRNVHLLVWILC